ncbi:MAG: formylmethanofuran dehydrogenase subunit C [Planctomycetota bacterium]|nr:formylmethanofuran dehydrogenase subunit C [Planctomycetota bacterium]
MITLTLKEQPGVPIEAEALSPDVVAELGHDEICALPIFLGKRQLRLDEFFEVEGEASEELEIRGDAGRIKWLGRGMTRGHLNIDGNAGMHLGAFMKGGTIEVSGNVSDWIGAEMSGGYIHIGGNAGGQIGAAYRGSLTGMTDGTIVVEGSAGLEVGMRMKRGTIVVKGMAKDFTGLEMKGGTIILGGAELRTGAWMNRGTIISLAPIPLLPTFAYNCSYNPIFLRIYARELAALGVSVPFEESEGTYELYSGDAAVSRKGELLIWKPAG